MLLSMHGLIISLDNWSRHNPFLRRTFSPVPTRRTWEPFYRPWGECQWRPRSGLSMNFTGKADIKVQEEARVGNER
jgi:hypothetical protein